MNFHPPAGSDQGSVHSENDIEVEFEMLPNDEVQLDALGPFSLGPIEDHYDIDFLVIGTVLNTRFNHFNNWMKRELFITATAPLIFPLQLALPEQANGPPGQLAEELLEELAEVVTLSWNHDCVIGILSYPLWIANVDILLLDRVGDPLYENIRNRMIAGINICWAWDLHINPANNWEGWWPHPNMHPYRDANGDMIPDNVALVYPGEGIVAADGGGD